VAIPQRLDFDKRSAWQYLPQVKAALLFMLLVPSSSAAALAQGNSSGSVSSELARILMTTFGIAAPEGLRVSLPAAGFPVGVLPGSVVVMGSHSSADRALTFAETPQIFAAVDQEIRAALSAAGWSNVASAISVRSGFVPSLIDTVRSTASPPPVTAFCKGTESIQYRQSRAIRAPTVITFTHTRNLPAANCNPARNTAAPLNQNPIPMLVTPPGARPFEGNTSAGANNFQSSMRLASSLPFPELADHFAAQFVADGWAQFDAAGSATSVIRSFIKPIPTGGTFVAVFTQVRLPNDAGIQLHVWARQR
jgi:hypothetical protein